MNANSKHGLIGLATNSLRPEQILICGMWCEKISACNDWTKKAGIPANQQAVLVKMRLITHAADSLLFRAHYTCRSFTPPPVQSHSPLSDDKFQKSQVKMLRELLGVMVIDNFISRCLSHLSALQPGQLK